jgi:hypothetical protein
MLLTLNKQRMDQLTPEDIVNYQQRFVNILDTALPSITENTSDIKQKSGANNYASLAPYYHPSPDTETGFPYIRQDGIRNTIAAETTDNKYLNKLYQIVIPCSLLYYLTKSENYALKAIDAINRFFIDGNTKMNPSLTYSGMVIGDSMEDLRIRGAIIDMNNLSVLPDFIQLLKHSVHWTSEIENGMAFWFDSLSDWFKTNPRGVLQASYSHNIKTSYMKQLCSYLCACGKEIEARAYLKNNLRELLSVQIDSTGNQILEMDRAINRNYSNFNLGMLVNLCIMSASLGVDVWNYENSEGRGSIKKAMRYLCYYYNHPEEWTFSDETSNNPAVTRKWLQAGVEIYDDELLSSTMNNINPYTPLSMPDYLSLPSRLY